VSVGIRKVGWCIDRWRECMEKNRWNGYDKRIAWADAPDWVRYEVEEKEALADVRVHI